MSNSMDPDETAHYEPSHLDLCCLQKPIIIAYGSERVEPHFYIVKLGFSVVYIIFLILLKKKHKKTKQKKKNKKKKKKKQIMF